MNFSKQVSQIAFRLKGYTEQQVRGTLLDLSKLIIKGTPADTGRLRGNWQASINAPITTQLNILDKQGNSSISDTNNVLSNLKLGNTFYLSNNLPYAAVVEFGGYPNPPKNPTGKTINGYSRQAPKGMVRINVKQAAQILDTKMTVRRR